MGMGYWWREPQEGVWKGKISEVEMGWMEWKVKRYSTLDYRDGSNSGSCQIGNSK